MTTRPPVDELHAIAKTAPATIPGFLTLLADWLDVINTGLSILFLAVSIAFLLWRWRQARNEKE